MLTTLQGMLNSLPARLAALASVISTCIWSFCCGPSVLGYSAESKGGATTVSAGTTPLVILICLLFAGFYWLLLNSGVEIGQLRAAPMWRRVAAFVVDMWFAVFTLGGLFGIFPLVMEEERTGTFQWHFERHYAVAGDTADIVLVMVSLVAFAGYFLLPLLRRSQTIGCWIFRLATVNSDGYVVHLPLSIAVLRMASELRGLCSPIKTFRTRDAQGRTFYDRDSGFTVGRY
jgi:uncharacterized RDD family membrane protein YckC